MTAPASYVSTGITVTFAGLTAELMDVDHGGETVSVVELPNQAGGYVTKKSSNLKNPGAVTLSLGYDPDNTAMPELGASGTLAIQWPTGTTKKFSCSAILQKRGQVAAKLGQRIVKTVVFELTGTPNWAAT